MQQLLRNWDMPQTLPYDPSRLEILFAMQAITADSWKARSLMDMEILPEPVQARLDDTHSKIDNHLTNYMSKSKTRLYISGPTTKGPSA